MRFSVVLLAALLADQAPGQVRPDETRPRAAVREDDPAGPVITFTVASGRVGELIPLKAVTDGKLVRWKAVDPGISLIPGELLRDSKVTVCLAMRPGTYRVHAVTAAGDVPSAITEVAVTVTAGPGPTPPPGPGPGPEPAPETELAREARRLFQADPADATAKRTAAAKLLGFYRALASHLRKPESRTVGDFRNDWQAAQSDVLADLDPAVLGEFRRLLGGRLGSALGTDTEAPLDPEIRPRAVKALADVVTALEALTGSTKR